MPDTSPTPPPTQEKIAMRNVAIAAVQEAGSKFYDGPGIVNRAYYLAAILDGLHTLAPSDDLMRAMGKLSRDLRAQADYDLEELWPK